MKKLLLVFMLRGLNFFFKIIRFNKLILIYKHFPYVIFYQISKQEIKVSKILQVFLFASCACLNARQGYPKLILSSSKEILVKI